MIEPKKKAGDLSRVTLICCIISQNPVRCHITSLKHSWRFYGDSSEIRSRPSVPILNEIWNILIPVPGSKPWSFFLLLHNIKYYQINWKQSLPLNWMRAKYMALRLIEILAISHSSHCCYCAKENVGPDLGLKKKKQKTKKTGFSF